MKKESVQYAKIVSKPWGEERIFAHTKNYAGKILNCK